LEGLRVATTLLALKFFEKNYKFLFNITVFLHLFSFNLPISWADLSEQGTLATLLCAFSMHKGVILQEFKSSRV
jgi:hypothetical protein